nr:hypothetical protein DBT45_10575 [Aerococcus tenax]
MASEAQNPEKALSDVRREIDTIDDAIQDLLMKRTELVVAVAEAKARSASAAGHGSFIAFRPGREAEVLRRLASRQKGRFPLKVVFRLFREVISTMTRIQGPFRVDVFGAENRLVVGQAAFEPTGDDTSLLVVTGEGDVSDAALAQRVKAAGFTGERVGVALSNDGRALRHNLFAVAGHVEETDARLAALGGEAPVAAARIIGGYANPVKRAKDGE